MKQSVVREKSDVELTESLELELENYSRMKKNHAVSQIENPMLLKISKRTIARLKTEVRKRELTKKEN